MSEKVIPPFWPRFVEGFRWSVRLGGRFLREAPGGTSLVVLATLVSQLAMLMAFFLPLKVVILLGSDQIPRYFPPILAEFDRSSLIVGLTLATVGAFVLLLLAERLIRFGSDLGARRILQRNRKVELFENQDAIAVRAYRRYAAIPAGAAFLLLGVGVLGWLYPSVLVLLMVFLLLVALLVGIGSRFSGALRRKALSPPKAWLPGLAQFGFLLVFVWLVFDYLYGNQPGLLAAIVALLLSRQMLNRLAGLVTNMVVLNRERPRLDALFFHHQVFMRRRHRQGLEGVWALVDELARQDWIPRVLREVDATDRVVRRTEYWQTRVPDVVMIHCEMENSDPRLVKVFGTNRSGEARHEASLLAVSPAGLPAPDWIGATTIEGLSCHVLRLPTTAQRLSDRVYPWSETESGSAELDESAEDQQGFTIAEQARRFRESLIMVEPPGELAGRYGRSRPLLDQRLDPAIFERLRVLADAGGRDCIDALLADFEALRESVRTLPWMFVNRHLNPDTLAVAGDETIALHWGRWGLETLGTAWPLELLEPDVLEKLLAEAGRGRPAVAQAAPSAVRLAGLLSTVERLGQSQRYAEALELLPALMEALCTLRGSGRCNGGVDCVAATDASAR